MEIRCFPYGPLQANEYLLVFGQDALIIDPCVRLDLTETENVHIHGIFLTHGHYDHICEAEYVRKKTGAIVLAHELECPLIIGGNRTAPIYLGRNVSVQPPICALKDKDILRPSDFGFSWQNEVEFRVIHTPGHSIGSMCLLVTEKTGNDETHVLFSGDTVFADTIGRTDLDGSMEDMQRSLMKLSLLPDDVLIYPGHGPSTTLGREKRQNPYFTAFR